MSLFSPSISDYFVLKKGFGKGKDRYRGWGVKDNVSNVVDVPPVKKIILA